MIKNVLPFMLLLCFCNGLLATPLKTYVFDKEYKHLSAYYQYFEDCDGSNEVEVLKQFYKGNFIQQEPNITFNKGITNCTYWLVVNVKNTTIEKQKLLWSFYNNGLSFSFYELRNGKLIFLDKSSMHELIDQRPYPVRSISFPFYLQQNETKTLFVKVTPTINVNIYFPTDITDVEDFLFYEVDFSFLLGKYFGIFLFAFFVNVCMFLILKERIYLYNSVYIIFVVLFQLSEFHFDSLSLKSDFFMFFSYINKNLYIALALFFYIKIFQIFTDQQIEYPKLYVLLRKFNHFLILTISIVIISQLVIHDSKWIFYANVGMYVINNLGFLCLFMFLIFGLIKAKKYYLFFTISSLLLIYGWISYLLMTFNIIRLPIISPGNVINGFVIEISLLTIFMVYKYKLEKDNYSKQIINKINQNELLTVKLLEIQESERNAIAQNLHDEVGSVLTGLRLLLQNNFSKKTIKPDEKEKILSVLKEVYQKVRTITYHLKPKELENNSFIEVIEEHIIFYKKNIDSIELEFITNLDNDFIIKDEVETQIYRIIIEILSNAFKHSLASKITLQLLFDAGTLIIMLEDDGIGFNATEIQKGIGLKNVKSRVNFLNGKMTTDSNHLGSTFIIEIPIL
jgi:signal transduction histidine kinase